MKLHFQAGRETGAAAAAQGRGLEFSDHLFRRDFLFQNTAQRTVAAAFHVILQMPVLAVQVGQDQRGDVAIVE
ncbi:hypothetical protein LP420_33335 [Massilia sp. B-10]|nr:hypothetical protein LP420_33335 [Massilia sp. B-10]